MEALLSSLAPGEAATLGHLAAAQPDKMRRVLQAIATDIDTMDTIASDIPPRREPFTDYITEFDVRCELFTKYRAMTQGVGDEDPLLEFGNATTLAVFMVAPVHELRNSLAMCETVTVGTINPARDINHIAPEAIRACTSYAYFFKFCFLTMD